jgi:hypothetical protein
VFLAACTDRTTAPVDPDLRQTVQLVGAGDIANCASVQDSLTAELLDLTPDAFVFAAGDNLHDATPAATYEGCFGPNWGRALDRTLPAMGNHDYDHESGARYFEYFGQSAGPAGLGYYRRDLGAWRILVLNSNQERVPTAAGSAQELWLRRELRDRGNRCTLALWHHPRFYHGTFHRNAAVRAFWVALLEARADVVVNGHFHLYERYAPQGADSEPAPTTGIRQFTVGTGGRTLDALHEPAPNLEFRQNTAHGVLRLTLGDGWYGWAFVDTDRVMLDTGSAPCHR